MYANRYAAGPRFRPASLGAALAMNGGVIAAVLLAAPELITRKPPPDGIDIIDIKLPPEPQPKPKPQPFKAEPRPVPTNPVVIPKPEIDFVTKTDHPIIEPAGGDPKGTGYDPIVRPVDPPPPPLFVGVRDDPRYRGGFQPPYPDFERDAGREDVVKLRVLVGVDGRVKQVVRLDGRESFVRAATAHALAKWRFLPATRGGVPEESWRTMTVRFQLGA